MDGIGILNREHKTPAMAASGNIPALMEAEGRGSFRWKLVETVTSNMRHKDEVTSSNREFWVRIAKLMSSKEVLAIWKKMKKRVAQKAIAHIVNGDIPFTGADVDKNLSPLDWLMYDRFLVINCTDSSLKLFEEDITLKQQNTMIMIFHFVQKFHIEGLIHKNPVELPQAWWNLCVEYCKCGRRGSVMLLQWRWHMMKLATRSIFYKYWEGGARRQIAVEANVKPKPIHIAIAKRYPHVVVEEVRTWQQFLATDRIVLPDQLEKMLMAMPLPELEKSVTDEANEDDDLVLIEPETDTIDLLDDDDEDILESNMEQFLQIDGTSTEMDLKVRTEVYDYANSASKEVDVRPIKIEPNLGVAAGEDFSKADSGLESIRVENVQSVKVIAENCKVDKAKTVDVCIGEDNIDNNVENVKSVKAIATNCKVDKGKTVDVCIGEDNMDNNVTNVKSVKSIAANSKVDISKTVDVCIGEDNMDNDVENVKSVKAVAANCKVDKAKTVDVCIGEDNMDNDVENVQSVKAIAANCKVDKAKTTGVCIGEDNIDIKAKRDEDTVIVIVDDDPEKAVEVLDTKEDTLKGQKKIPEIENEAEEINEEDEEDIIMITEEDNEPTNGFLDMNTQQQKADEENSISACKQILIDVNEEESKEKSKEKEKKSPIVLKEDSKDAGFCRDDTMHNDVDLDQEDDEEVMDIDDVTLKSLERQHITMKFDDTHPVTEVSSDSVEEDVSTSTDNLPSPECQDSSFDFSEDVKLISDCVVEIDKLEDMPFFENKTLNCEATISLKDFVYVRPSKIVANKKVLVTESEEMNNLLVEHSAVPVTCHAQRTQSILTNICERIRNRPPRKKRFYEPDEILRNPDFEPKLLDLPTSFYTIPENVTLLKACVPATVDIFADFTIADQDGAIEVVDPDLVDTYNEMKKIPGHVLVPATKKLNKTPARKRSGVKQAHFLDRILKESSQMGEIHKDDPPPSVSATLNTITSLLNQNNTSDKVKLEEMTHEEETLVRKSKPVCLPSISEVRKINQGLKTAQVAPIIPQNSMFASDEADTRIGEVLPIEFDLPAPNLPQNSLPPKLVLNKKGVSFVSALRAPSKTGPRLNGPWYSPWYKPRPPKFDANLSMSSLCTMLKSLQPQSEQLDGVEQKRKRYCCTLKRHHLLNEARQRLVDKRFKKKSKLMRILNIHKHSFAECECCCKNVYPETLYSSMKPVNNPVTNEDIVDPTPLELQEHSGDELRESEENLAKLTDTQEDTKDKEENVCTDQSILKSYLRVLKPSELMAQQPNKPISMDSETQTGSDLANSVSVDDLNVVDNGMDWNGQNERSVFSVKRKVGRPRKNVLHPYQRKKPLVKKMPQQRQKTAGRKVITVSDESEFDDESGSAFASEISAEEEGALVSIGPIANPVLKISCVLTEAEEDSVADDLIPEEPVFQQPPDAEILITEVKSAQEIAPTDNSLFQDKFKPIIPNETMIPLLDLPDNLIPLPQSQPENLSVDVPKRDDLIELKKTTEKSGESSSSRSRQETQDNTMLVNLLGKLGLDSADPLLRTASLDDTDGINSSEVISYIVCDQMNVPKQCVVINRRSNKVLHTVHLPGDKTWDVSDLQRKIYMPDYITINKGDDLKLISAENVITNEDVNLVEKSQSNDIIVIDNDEGNNSNAVNDFNGNSYAGVIDVSVLHETNGNQPATISIQNEADSVQGTAVWVNVDEFLPKSHANTGLSQSTLFENHRSVETNEVSEIESQVVESTKSIPHRGNSILMDLVDQLGINSETVSGFNTNSATENASLGSDNDQVVMQLDQPVLAIASTVSIAKTTSTISITSKERLTEFQEKTLCAGLVGLVSVNGQVVMQLDRPLPAMASTTSIANTAGTISIASKEKLTELQENTLRSGEKIFFTSKKRAVVLNNQTRKQREDITKKLRYVGTPGVKYKIKTLNSGDSLGSNQLNVKRVADDTFTIIGADAGQSNSEVMLKKSHLAKVINSDSLLVKRNIVRVQKPQTKGRVYDEDFVVKPGLQYARNKPARRLRSKARINLKESSDEDDDVPLINLHSNVPSLMSKPLMDTLTVVRGSNTLILDVANSHAKRVLEEIGDMQPVSVSDVKSKRETLDNASDVIDLDEDSTQEPPEYLEEEYLDDVLIDLDDMQNINNACSNSQEEGKEDCELILGM